MHLIMSFFEIFLIGVALSMDAFAVGMSNGMAEPNMKTGKLCSVALAFALFQFGMPLLGYVSSGVFSALVAGIAPWLSFLLLGIIGGKMIYDYFREYFGRLKSGELCLRLPVREVRGLTAGKLFTQAVATSLDALAVGVTLLAVETKNGLPFHVVICAGVIGVITFCLSAIAVFLGKKAGSRFSDEATLAGGLTLVAIGVKLLIEGIL